MMSEQEGIQAAEDSKGSPLPASAEIEEQAVTAITVTEEDDRRIRRKTDRVVLALLIWVYFLQVLDKAVLGTSAVFNLQKDAHLVGRQYSLIGSIAPIAQIAWQPFSAWLIVRVPHRILMPALVLGWGIAESAAAGCTSFGSLLATRFLLGLFEAGCLPLFAIMTSRWYRRAEQPIRIAWWSSMNGTSSMAASLLSYGLGHVTNGRIYSWQIIFLFVGLVTVVSAPIVYWKLDNDVSTARFLSEEDRLKGVERLRTNNVGDSNEFVLSQAWEAVLDPKTWLWVVLAILPNIGSALPGVFGPLIIKGFGFDQYQTLLLNLPFGFLTWAVVIGACWVVGTMKMKGLVLAAFIVPCVVGSGMLYGLHRTVADRPALLVAYYLESALFAGNPILMAWAVGNTGGTTKKSVTLAFYQAGTSAGALIGPLLFSADQAPNYLPGIAGVLGVFVAMIVLIFVQLGYLVWLNRQHRRRRVRNGKSENIVDLSMQKEINLNEGKQQQPVVLAEYEQDLTDRQNDEFVYIY